MFYSFFAGQKERLPLPQNKMVKNEIKGKKYKGIRAPTGPSTESQVASELAAGFVS